MPIVTDTDDHLPSRQPRPPSTDALAGVAARWQAAEALPPTVSRSVVDRVRLRLATGGRTPLDGASAYPAGWPPPAQAVAAMSALAELEEDVIAALLQDDALEASHLAAVHAEFAAARQRLAAAQDVGGPPPLTLAQALASRDRQLSIATHELRTPISSILLNLQILERLARERGSVDADAVARMLAVPSRQLRRLTRMVDLLLDVAQVETERLTLRPEPMDLCEVVHEAAGRLQELAHQCGCSVSLEGCEPVPGHWDRLRLEQVVTNLMTNAIKYGGGRVEVQTRRDDQARIVVRDHGGGIAPEDRSRIFHPFERLASTQGEDGAGLGLYIVREIVRAHGGSIEVESAPGGGSIFTVSLPV